MAPRDLMAVRPGPPVLEQMAVAVARLPAAEARAQVTVITAQDTEPEAVAGYCLGCQSARRREVTVPPRRPQKCQWKLAERTATMRIRRIAPSRVLIVAHHTADSPELIEAVSDRARSGPCRFTLLVPASPRGLHRVVDPEDHGTAEARQRLDDALPLLSEAAGLSVVGIVGSHDPVAAVQDALNLLGFDEVIVSMLPVHLSRWLRLDLPRKIEALGVPVRPVVSSRHVTAPSPTAA